MEAKLFLIFGLVVFVFACQPAKNQEMTTEQRQEIAKTIRKEVKDILTLQRDFTVENHEKLLLNWVESDDKAWMGNPALWFNMLYLYPDKESLESWRPTPTSTRTATNFYIDEDYVAVISPECALYTFKGSFTITNKNGETTEKTPNSGSFVYVLRNGEWKILHTHQSWTNN